MKNLWQRERDSYRGLESRCAPGLHEIAAAILSERIQARGSVLDLASGSGAFLARLRDAGFTKLHAVELDTGSFKLQGVDVDSLDLNDDFALQLHEQYGLISAIEIIEHLDNPRHFLRQIHRLLSDDGYLLVSTPNVSHWVGRLRFFLWGELRYFRESDYHQQRHISPIVHNHMVLMLEEVGFRLVHHTTAGSFHGVLKWLIAAPVALISRAIFGRAALGDVNIYLAQKRSTTSDSPGSSSYYFLRYGSK